MEKAAIQLGVRINLMFYSNFRVLQPASGPLSVIGHSCNSIYTLCVCTCARLPMHAHSSMLAHQQTHTFNLMKASEKKEKRKLFLYPKAAPVSNNQC